MDRGVAVALATAIGGTLALQAPLNSLLGRTVGGLQAAIVAFAIGLCALLAVSVLAGGVGGIANAGDVRWWVLVGGGLISALYVASIVFTMHALGAGGLTAATIAGQFAIALAVRPLRLAGRRAPADHARPARRSRAAGGGDMADRLGLAAVEHPVLHFGHHSWCVRATVAGWPSPTLRPAP